MGSASQIVPLPATPSPTKRRRKQPKTPPYYGMVKKAKEEAFLGVRSAYEDEAMSEMQATAALNANYVPMGAVRDEEEAARKANAIKLRDGRCGVAGRRFFTAGRRFCDLAYHVLCCKPRGPVYSKVAKRFGLTSHDAKMAVTALSLKMREVRRLRDRFKEADAIGEGSIEPSDFFAWMKEAPTPFTDGLFHLCDFDHDSLVKFDEFLLVVICYSLYTRLDILLFAWNVFGGTGGEMDEEAVGHMLDSIANLAPKRGTAGNMQKLRKQLKGGADEDGKLMFDEFKEVALLNPLVLHPAYALQEKIQKTTMGERWWLHLLEDIEKQRRIDAYKAQHFNRSPPWKHPPPLLVTLGCARPYRKIGIDHVEEFMRPALGRPLKPSGRAAAKAGDDDSDDGEEGGGGAAAPAALPAATAAADSEAPAGDDDVAPRPPTLEP